MNTLQIDDSKIVELYQSGKSSSELAKQFNCSIWAIINRIKKCNIPIRVPPMIDDAKLKELHESGLPTIQIAKAMNITYARLGRKMQELGLQCNYTKQPDKEKVRELHGQQLSNAAIAKQMGFSSNAIGKAVKKLGLKANHNGALEIIDGNGKCIKCDGIKPLTNFYNYTKRSKYSKTCNKCRLIERRKQLNSSIEKAMAHRVCVARGSAKKKGLPFDLDGPYLMDVYDSQSRLCFYTDRVMSTDFGIGVFKDTLSIDRIVPEKGYVKGNVVICCYKINSVKNDLSLIEVKDYMPEWFRRITNAKWLNKEGYPQ